MAAPRHQHARPPHGGSSVTGPPAGGGRRPWIDPAALEVTAQASPGPGGQNVNKAATAIRLRFDLARARGLAEPVRLRAARLAGRRLTADGAIVLLAARHRSQEANRRDALERLAALLAEAAKPPRPRLATRPTAAARARRLAGKAHRSARKASRRPPGEED